MTPGRRERRPSSRGPAKTRGRGLSTAAMGKDPAGVSQCQTPRPAAWLATAAAGWVIWVPAACSLRVAGLDAGRTADATASVGEDAAGRSGRIRRQFSSTRSR